MIYIAGDKHGYKAIKFVEEYLREQNMRFKNLGVKSNQEELRLEKMIPPLATKVLENTANKGILSCGTGVGVEVGANKFSGIRACLATNEKIAEWAKAYDNCNVLCLVGWDADKEKIYRMLNAWLHAEYDGNKGRLKMFEKFNAWH